MYQDPKFKIGDIVRKSICKNTFAKGYVPNLSEEAFMIKKVNSTGIFYDVYNAKIKSIENKIPDSC